MAKKSLSSPFSSALLRVRRHLGYQQSDLAKRLSVSRRSIVRWERCDCIPEPRYRAHYVQRLSDLPYEVLHPFASALGVELDPLAHVGGTAGAKRVLDEHLHLVAESADVSARRLREAVVAVLAKAEELKLTVEGAKGLLAQGAGAGASGVAKKS
ncbi:MAG: helix-turn-helix transcriptional regulator [Polyangiaceae bacterium]